LINGHDSDHTTASSMTMATARFIGSFPDGGRQEGSGGIGQ
jgi:hypothetical protein